MERTNIRRLLSAAMALIMLLSLLPAGSVFAEPLLTSTGAAEYVFDSLVDVVPGADKDVIPEGTTYANGYFKVVGKVTQRFQESKGGVYAVEIAKNLTGAIEFTVSDGADVTLTVSSTGGSNESAVGIMDGQGKIIANNEGLSTVTGTSATTLTYSDLAAGTYQIVSPENETLNRGFRLMTVRVVDAPAAATAEYVFNSLSDVAPGADKDVIPEGTTYADGYFKVVGKLTQRFQESKGGVYAVEIAKNLTGAMEFTVSGSADVTLTVSSTGGSNESAVAIVDAQGNEVSNNEGLSTVTGTSATTLTYTGLAAGTYQIVSPVNETLNRGFRLMTVRVVQTSSEAGPSRLAWDQVAAPVITDAKQNEDTIEVTYDMVIGTDGADTVTIILTDSLGRVVGTQSIAKSGERGSASFTPAASDTYTVMIHASRANETDKLGNEVTVENFLLPLNTPTIASATSLGEGRIGLVWDRVAEADSYNVYCDGILLDTVSSTEYTASGLNVGTKYTFTVEAVRGTEISAASPEVSTTATQQTQIPWSFLRYGPSTNDSSNYYTGSINEEGKVTLFSVDGKGKIQPKDSDGLAYYYTAIPADQNFTFRATVTVDTWKYSNGQEGFGLLAMDSLPKHGDSTHWTNQYMVMLGKVEYFYDFVQEKVVLSANENTTKYSMRLGLGVLPKLGMTPENIDKVNAMDTDTILQVASGITYPLDLTAAKLALPKDNYNIVGNCSNSHEAPNKIGQKTTFILEIQKNNTGYFITYYDDNGNIIGQQKNYDPNALQVLDTEYVYVGFFAARNVQATFSDVEVQTMDPSQDAPAEERPVSFIDPSCQVASPAVANDPEYTLSLNANVAGTALITVNGVGGLEVPVTGGIRTDIPLTLQQTGYTQIDVEFRPDPNQELGESLQLSNTDPVLANIRVSYVTDYANQRNLYVAHNGKPTATGYYQDPIDIYTAVAVAQPGQTIVLLEGTYYLSKNVLIARGIDGTEDAPIRMIADPNAKTRPVLNFAGANNAEGITAVGSYWYFQGFDVVKTFNGKAGFHVAGHHITLDQINAYDNGGTGIQISRYQGSDLKSEWPSNNLILNCTSSNNADSGYEDADGFGAKLTIGEGNVFDGCVAYNNADDGWDLYAKVETGRIGAVTIRNCVAYQNGYVWEYGKLVNAGNGNGFKMGGSNIAGAHKLINSYAFFNKAKGIDSNSCPDIIVENAISYNNESYNVAFYTNITQNTAFVGSGIISFKDSTIGNGLSIGENLKPKGNQLSDDPNIWNDTNYYWDGSQSVNNSGVQVTADWFVSLEFRGVERNEDGTINMQGFLELTDAAASDAGARPAGTATVAQTVQWDDPFTDVTQDCFFQQEILWGYHCGVVYGTSATTCHPDSKATREQMIAFLWRAAGCPEPKSQENPFTDVGESNMFYTAIMWAYHEGITGDQTATTFAPGDICTRAQAVEFLYRYAGSPDVSGKQTTFTDVGDSSEKNAIVWAQSVGVTTGRTESVFDPNGACLRAEAIAFLYRYITAK